MTDLDTRLPGEAPDVTRWTPARKYELLRRIREGELSEAEACARFGFTAEELGHWAARLDRFGWRGLSTIHLQEARHVAITRRHRRL